MVTDRRRVLAGREARADLRAYRRHVEAVDADRADALVTGGYSADEIGDLSGGLIRASDVEADVAVEDAPVFLSEDGELGDCEGGGYLVDKVNGEVVTTWCGSEGCAKHMAERSARRLAEVLLGFVYSFPGMRSALLTLTWPTKPERWTWAEYCRRGGVDQRAVWGAYEALRKDEEVEAEGDLTGDMVGPWLEGLSTAAAIWARENVLTGRETVYLLSWQWAKLRRAHYDRWGRSMDYCANLEATGQGVLHLHGSLPVPASWSMSTDRVDLDERETYRRWLLAQWVRIVPGAKGVAQSLTFEGEKHTSAGYELAYDHRSPATAVAYQTAYHEFQGKHPMPERYRSFVWHRWRRSQSWKLPLLGADERFQVWIQPVKDVEGEDLQEQEERVTRLRELRDTAVSDVDVREAAEAGLWEALEPYADHFGDLDLYEYKRLYGWLDYWTKRRTVKGVKAVVSIEELAQLDPGRMARWVAISWEYDRRARKWEYVSVQDGQDAGIQVSELDGPVKRGILWPDYEYEALPVGAAYLQSAKIPFEWWQDIVKGRKSVRRGRVDVAAERVDLVEVPGIGGAVSAGTAGVLVT